MDLYSQAYHALKNRDISTFKSIITRESLPVIDIRKYPYDSIIYAAIDYNAYEFVKWLLECGLDVNKCPLCMMYLSISNHNIMQLLIEHCFKASKNDLNDFMNYAVECNKSKMFKVLLDYGVEYKTKPRGFKYNKFNNIIRRRNNVVRNARIVLGLKQLRRRIGRDCVKMLSQYIFARRYKGL